MLIKILIVISAFMCLLFTADIFLHLYHKFISRRRIEKIVDTNSITKKDMLNLKVSDIEDDEIEPILKAIKNYKNDKN